MNILENRCEAYCNPNRKGELVCQYVEPPNKLAGIAEPWVFRHYMCRWCRGAYNRKRFKGQRKMVVLKYRSDEELLKEYKENRMEGK